MKKSIIFVVLFVSFFIFGFNYTASAEKSKNTIMIIGLGSEANDAVGYFTTFAFRAGKQIRSLAPNYKVKDANDAVSIAKKEQVNIFVIRFSSGKDSDSIFINKVDGSGIIGAENGQIRKNYPFDLKQLMQNFANQLLDDSRKSIYDNGYEKIAVPNTPETPNFKAGDSIIFSTLMGDVWLYADDYNLGSKIIINDGGEWPTGSPLKIVIKKGSVWKLGWTIYPPLP